MTYKDFIQNILDSRGRFGCNEEYHERHHIVPKCLGGSNDKENLIDLYAREHFIAHQLLAKENPQELKLVQAYNIMAFTHTDKQNRYEATPEECALDNNITYSTFKGWVQKSKQGFMYYDVYLQQQQN